MLKSSAKSLSFPIIASIIDFPPSLPALAARLPTAQKSKIHIKAAIKNFDPANKIGEGGFGSVYKDVMEDPRIAVDGYIYKGDAIKGWLYSGHDTSPMTNLNLDTCV
ncbi:hypothetical protein FXO38_20210 [Capsicum annuum]|nr:hypothetical protein FXO38_20210 [Capsicum annuum]